MSPLLRLLQPIFEPQYSDNTISVEILLDTNGGTYLSISASVNDHVACVRHCTRSPQRFCAVTITHCPRGGTDVPGITHHVSNTLEDGT